MSYDISINARVMSRDKNVWCIFATFDECIALRMLNERVGDDDGMLHVRLLHLPTVRPNQLWW